MFENQANQSLNYVLLHEHVILVGTFSSMYLWYMNVSYFFFNDYSIYLLQQTSYSDMLDLAVQHIKGLQSQIQVYNLD